MKKIISLLICFVIIFTFSLSVLAQDGGQNAFFGGIVDAPRRLGDGASVASQSDHSSDITNETRKAVFDAICEGFKSYAAQIDLASYKIPLYINTDNTSESVFFDIFYDVCEYLPEAYYVKSINYGYYYDYYGNTYISYLRPIAKDGYTKEKYENELYICEMELLKIINSIPDNLNDIQKIVYIHDYMVSNYCYDLTYTIYDMYGLLTQKTGVCQAYTMVFKSVMDRLGIECHTSVSEIDDHIWNVVKVNGKYYYVDCTNDDPTKDRLGRAIHKNLLLSYDGLIAQNNHTNPTNVPYHINYSCTDKTFEGAAFVNIQGPTFEHDGAMYGITSTLPQKLIRYSDDFLSSTVVASYNSGYTSSNYNVSSVKIGNEVYFNGYNDIVKYDFTTKSFTCVASFTTPHSLFACYLSKDGKIGVLGFNANGTPDYTNESGAYYDICMGDLDYDTTVTATDLAILKNHLLGFSTDVKNIEGLADINHDYQVNLLDLVRMKMYVAGNIANICA